MKPFFSNNSKTIAEQGMLSAGVDDRTEARQLKTEGYGAFATNGRRAIRITEEEIYTALGLRWTPPELRENRGKLAKTSNANLVRRTDMKGDFELHSVWSDGRQTVRDIAAHLCFNFPQYEYVVLTDHSGPSAMAAVKDHRLQWAEIDAINSELGRSFIKKGVEVEIGTDGSLALADDELKHFDWVTASIQSYYSRGNTERILKACENPFVNAIGHPTGRLAGIRSGYPIDMSKVIKAALETGTALEINAQPERMDMDETWTRCSREQGVKVIIGSDSRSLREFDYIELGVTIARNACCSKKDVLNTMSWPDIEKLVKAKRCCAN